MAIIYHNGEESIKKYKGKVLARLVGGQFWKTITREVDFQEHFFLDLKGKVFMILRFILDENETEV